MILPSPNPLLQRAVFCLTLEGGLIASLDERQTNFNVHDGGFLPFVLLLALGRKCLADLPKLNSRLCSAAAAAAAAAADDDDDDAELELGAAEKTVELAGLDPLEGCVVTPSAEKPNK